MRIEFKQLNIQKTAEKILFGWVFLIVMCHLLLATFQYVILYRNYRPYLLWPSLIFILAVALYVILSLALSASSRSCILETLKKYFTFEQVVLLVIFLWFVLSIYLNGAREKNLEGYFRAHDWYIFDTFLCMLVIFPLPRLLGRERTKRVVELLIHAVVILYSVFTIVCLWHIFHLEILDFPSGYQAGMTEDIQLMLGFHPNNTGMIAATLFCLCVYMLVTQNWAVKIIYIIFAFAQLITTYLTNSRTPFLAIVLFLAFAAFWLVFYSLKNRNIFLRILFSLAVSALTAALFWKARSWTFIAFENITHFKENLASELTARSGSYTPTLLASSHSIQAKATPIVASYGADNTRQMGGLSGREGVWNTCIRIMTSSRFNFFFGITPATVSKNITTVGRFSKEIAHAHNSILQIGVCTGVPMMAFYVVFLLNLIIRCLRCLFRKTEENNIIVVLCGGILCFILINMAEAYLFAYFSVISCFFYLFSGWITELDDEIPILVPAKKRAILKATVSALAYAACIIALLLYADRYINLNPKRIPGSGTRSDPYLIEDKDDLCYFRDLVNHGNYFEKCYFLQTEDIDLQDTDWEPVGSWATGNSFEGIYDGSCHVIKNLTISLSHSNSRNEGRVALFGLLNGTVQNLGIESGSINGYRCGSIASISNYGAAIINCYNKASIIGSMRAGGICDHFNEGIVMNCLNEGILTAPVISELVSWDAKLVYGQTQEKDTTETFKGTFYPLLYQGETAQEKLNSGLNELLQKGIIGNNQISFW